ncbi:MAG: hypothetical protein HGA72_06045 [Chlorobiaceae bacterium]|jgi:hypothetical protein|nr:hypothetical protein [Chlorobiaceae bacterium]
MKINALFIVLFLALAGCSTSASVKGDLKADRGNSDAAGRYVVSNTVIK